MESDRLERRLTNIEHELSGIAREMKVWFDRTQHLLDEVERRVEKLTGGQDGINLGVLLRNELREQMKGIRDEVRELQMLRDSPQDRAHMDRIRLQ